MELIDSFNTTMYVPNITTLNSIDNVLASLGSYDDSCRAQIASSLTNLGVGSKISVSVKKLIYMAEMASQDEEKVEKLVSTISEEGVSH